MSQRTSVCAPCRKSYRRSQDLPSLQCPKCRESCQYVHRKIRIPSPRRAKAWECFRAKYRAEKALLETFRRDELREVVNVELLNMELHPA